MLQSYMVVTIDTYQAMKSLTEGDAFSQIQAERILDVMADASEELATRADINELGASTRASINELRISTDSKIDKLDSKIEILRRDLTIRMFAGFISMTAIILTAIRLMLTPDPIPYLL